MHWIEACSIDDLEPDEVLRLETEVGPVAVYRLDDGFYATQDTCTHAVASLADGFVEDGMIECPLHAARFCIRTGKARSMPATVPLNTYPVKIEGSRLMLGLPESSEVSP
ncbi:bifunctional 3-phenylpropionate/cinnamic acid dioxygenase ferredoxin subunit [Pseudomonas sp. S 311-6]|nr:bifunctional 3-phenylpropionate/cinnamic acid dioxygenase ferredoxin subunit [Pseudomonas sp. S 311-6]